MNFGHPWVLWLLAIPLLLLAWQWLRGSPRVAVPLDHGRQRPHRWLARILALAGAIPALLLRWLFSSPLRR
jgi:hypothetical protein